MQSIFDTIGLGATFVWGIVVYLWNPAYAPFITILLIVAYLMYKAHQDKREDFSIFDLLTDSVTRRASIEKIFVTLAGLSVTWWFIDLVAQRKATLNDALAYGGLMGLAKVASDVIKAKYPTAQATAATADAVVKADAVKTAATADAVVKADAVKTAALDKSDTEGEG